MNGWAKNILTLRSFLLGNIKKCKFINKCRVQQNARIKRTAYRSREQIYKSLSEKSSDNTCISRKIGKS